MDSNNPLLKREEVFALEDIQPMTLDGTLIKTAILLVLCVLSASAAWTAQPGAQLLLMMVGAIGGLITVLVATFKPAWSPVLAPAYAILEGFVVGTISNFMEKQYPGLVANASLLTFGVLGTMLLLFVTRIIQVTQQLRAGVFAATLAIALVYLVDMLLHLFGVNIPFLHQTGAIGIGFSLVVLGIAAFNLLLDFDAIETGIRQKSPRHMEWYCGMALLVTLVWLYLEILRLLSKFRGRN